MACLESKQSDCSVQLTKKYCRKHYQQVWKNGHAVMSQRDKRPAVKLKTKTKIPVMNKGAMEYAIVDTKYSYLDKYNWCKSASGYAVTAIDGKTIKMHLLILPKKQGYVTDHISGNGLDNRKENLRYATHTENMRNKKLRTDNKTGRIGVQFYRGGGYFAQITKLGKKTYLGKYQNIDDATSAYDNAATELFGEFARLNHA